jgi:glycosyltransferase involved in cell wall biosynthesis
MISAIIPARNEEASIARVVASLAEQPEIGEIIVVDDESTDGTGAILAELASRISRLKILSTGSLPAGWVGKNYAASIGAEAATGDWLLFTDADTYHLRGSARRALSDAVDHDAVLVSYSPEQETETFWERALIPFVYCRLALRFSFARINDPKQPDAAANGQFLMILRDVYEAVGGHAAIAGQILEDVALARRVKREGYGIYFTAPMGIVRTRMYRSFGAMWQGWTKNLYPLMGGKPLGVFVELADVLPWVEIAMMSLFFVIYIAGRKGTPAWFLPALVLAALFGRMFRYGVDLYRNLYPVSYIKYYIPGLCVYCAALIASWWKSTQGAVIWKGRAYPARGQ